MISNNHLHSALEYYNASILATMKRPQLAQSDRTWRRSEAPKQGGHAKRQRLATLLSTGSGILAHYQ